MEIKVLFFGEIQQSTKQSELIISDVANTDELNEKIIALYSAIKNMSYRIAVNKVLINANVNLNNGDVIAFLPPFAGG